MGHVGADTDNWYLHSWIMIESYVSGPFTFLGVGKPNEYVLEGSWSGTVLTVTKGVSPTSITVPQFEIGKWFFMELGSSSSGYFGSLRFKSGTPYTATHPPSGYPITEGHFVGFPYGGTPATFKVSAK
jgi:hypothetical protein